MKIREAGGYRVGQYSWIDALGCGGRKFRVQGEILSIIPTSDNALWALIRTQLGTGVYRLW